MSVAGLWLALSLTKTYVTGGRFFAEKIAMVFTNIQKAIKADGLALRPAIGKYTQRGSSVKRAGKSHDAGRVFRINQRSKIMLVLTRKEREIITIGDTIRVIVIEIRGDKVRLGIEAPQEVAVHRLEVYEEIQREQEQDGRDCD